ncbi:MAG: hypothetical protein J6V00_09515, partial [Bacteroidaceae bacterium]|nr:hypothetical protein [Bacteroidaceae bacterium]
KISKCQIRNFKEPFWHFEMALNTVKQLVSILTGCSFIASIEVVSHTNQLGKEASWLVALTDCKFYQVDYNL